MEPSTSIVWLSWFVAALGAGAAAAGLLWSGGEGPTTFETLRAQSVTLFGRGLYRYDTLFAGAGNRGADAVTLFLVTPLLGYASLRYRRGSLKGGLFLGGALTWFLYLYASYALGATAYNPLFLLYVVLFSASLFTFAWLLTSFDGRGLADLPERLPRLGPGVFMIVSGLATLAIWLIAPLTALLTGGVPDGLDSYSTLFTTALDLAVVVPATVLSGVLILRGKVSGYLFAFPLLVLEALLAPMIAAQTVSQLRAGVSFTPAEIVGPISSFVVLATLALWVLASIYRKLPDGRTGAARPSSFKRSVT